MGSNSVRRAVGLLIVTTMVVLLQSVIASGSVDHGGYRPHYQGYGVNTPGGRGGSILKVTNLNDGGPGSLRAAMEARGPRIVIFEVSGTISLSQPIYVTSPFLTVAGQTAPSPGITLRYQPIYVKTHDVVVQHLRVRLGDTHQTPGSSCAFYIWSDEEGNSYNVVLDHMSLSWATSTMLSVTGRWRQISVLDSMFAFNLRTSYVETGGGALSAYWWEGEITYARNLFVHNSHRQPWFGAGARATAINNVMYGNGNSGGNPASLYGFMQIMVVPYAPHGETNSGWNTEVVAINNRFIPSYRTGSDSTTGSHSATKSIDVWLDGQPASAASRLYLSGNIGPHMTIENQWGGVDFLGSGSRATLDYGTVPAWHSNFGYDVIAPGDVTSKVFANAGARPADRDAVDTTAVKNAIAGLAGDAANMGSRITSQSQMGGWPVLAEKRRALQVPANPHKVAPGELFRTTVEVWLETFARELEGPSER